MACSMKGRAHTVLQSGQGLQSLLSYTLGVGDSGMLLNKVVPPRNESIYYQRMLSWVDSLYQFLCALLVPLKHSFIPEEFKT